MAGVKPVAIGELGGQAIAQAGGEQAGRIKAHHDPADTLDSILLDCHGDRELRISRRNSARTVEQRDQISADDPLFRVADAEAELLAQMGAEVTRHGREVVDPAIIGAPIAAARADRPGKPVGSATLVERIGVIGLHRVRHFLHADQVGRIQRAEGLGALVRGRLLRRSVGPLIPFQQRVALEFALHEGRNLKVGELKKLDGLTQLRRHHQRLRLPKL